MRQLVDPFDDPPAQGMVGHDERFGEQLVKPVKHRIGELLVEPGPAHHAASAVVDDGADEVFVVLDGQRGAADEAFDHRQVALVGNRCGEQLPE